MDIFVAYPYSFGQEYRDALERALPSPTFRLIYADERLVSDHILHKISDMLSDCELALFDLTTANVNVILELGIAIGSPHPYVVALTHDSAQKLMGDLHGWDQLRYKTYSDLGEKLRARIDARSVPTRRAVVDAARRRSRHGDYKLHITDDVRFFAKASTLKPEDGQTIKALGESFICFDSTLNLRLDSATTFINVAKNLYRVPMLLLEYQNEVIRTKNPAKNEDKIRLSSDLTRDSLVARSGIIVQETNYFASLTTNELATKKLSRTRFEDGAEESVCSVFYNYVGPNGRLAPLSESELSNHVGVTTLLITSDNYLVLQRQGETQIDPGKVTVGASGSADWSDIERSSDVVHPNGQLRKTLQQVVKFAVERETAEEIGVTIGPGWSKTTLTGFARFIHRGGKPEFFFITCVKQQFADIPEEISREEEKYVKHKMSRQIFGDSVEAVIEAVDRLVVEFADRGDASTSMLVAIDFAKDFLINSNLTLLDLRA